jgi:hypothetical protein
VVCHASNDTNKSGIELLFRLPLSILIILSTVAAAATSVSCRQRYRTQFRCRTQFRYRRKRMLDMKFTLLDQVLACSGIVKSLKSVLGDSCVLGLWKSRIPTELLWETLSPAWRCLVYRAPSWSWLLIDGGINQLPAHLYLATRVSDVEIEDVVISRAGFQNRNGIASAYIKLRGSIKEAPLTCLCPPSYALIVDGREDVSPSADEKNSQLETRKVWCLLVVTYPYINRLEEVA